MAGRALSFSFLLLFFFFPVAIGSFGSSPFLLPLVAASPPAPSLPHWCTLFVEGGGGGWPKGMSSFHQRHSVKAKLQHWKERE